MTDIVLYRTSDGLVICSRHAEEAFGRLIDAVSR